MAQLYFEPASSKIGADTFLVVPKNNSDTIDVADYNAESEEPIIADVKSGTYQFIAKCSEVVKDIIFGLWGNPTMVNGVKTGHSHSAEVVAALLVKYGNTFLPEERTVDGETVTGYPVEMDGTTHYYETQEAAFTAIVAYVKQKLRARPQAAPAEQESEVEENES